MLGRVVRVLVGSALAVLAAAATLVAFGFAPMDWAGVRAELGGERLAAAGLLAWEVILHIAVYAALPLVAVVVLAEARRIARWTFYALAGMAIASAGFVALYLGETPGQETIVHNYILGAFLSSGLVGGLVYWALSGRFARQAPPAAAEPEPQAAPSAPAGASSSPGSGSV